LTSSYLATHIRSESTKVAMGHALNISSVHYYVNFWMV